MNTKDTKALEHLGQRIRAARLSKGFAQERLAEFAGIDRSFVSRLERGKVNPTFLTLRKLANALDVELSQLVN